jgi:PST family polysaccharide transporter
MVARTAGTLLLNKLVVVYGGAGGLTQLAQFQTLMGLFGALPTNGVQVGAATYLAPLQVGQPRYRLWLAAAGWLTALLVGAAGLLLLVLGGPAWPAGHVLFFTGAMLLVSGQALLSGVLLLAGRRGAYVGLMVAVSAAGLVVVAGLLALGQPLGRVLLGYVGGQALVFGLALVGAHRAGLLGGWRQLGLPSRVALRGLLRFVLMAVGTQLFGQAINYALRAYLIRHYTPTATDLWQAVDKLSANYTMALVMVLSTVFYPRLAALAPRPAEQRHYVSVVAGLLALSLALGLGLLYGLRGPLLSWLFAPRLAAAASLLGPQLLGDWARFLGWVFQYTLLARGRPGPYLAVQAGTSVLYAGLLAGLVPLLGLPGVVDAYAVSYGLVLVGCVGWFYGKRL